jgi:hypothetical protein
MAAHAMSGQSSMPVMLIWPRAAEKVPTLRPSSSIGSTG